MQKKHPALNVAMQNNTKQHFFEYGVAFWNAVKNQQFFYSSYFLLSATFFFQYIKKSISLSLGF